jgi:hypothetical protein
MFKLGLFRVGSNPEVLVFGIETDSIHFSVPLLPAFWINWLNLDIRKPQQPV